MCSFVVFSSNKLNLSDFSNTLKKVEHRGPDNNYSAIENGLSWGFNRLSIMDLSSNGNQPFKYNSCELVCNGEIYNYQSLRELLSNASDAIDKLYYNQKIMYETILSSAPQSYLTDGKGMV